MTEHTFTIYYNSIIGRVSVDSGYTAAAREASGLPARLTMQTIATEDEKSIFDSIIPIAADECATSISHYLGKASATCNEKSRECSMTIMLPANYPTGSVPALENIIKEIVINRCLQQWYLITKPDEASIIAARLQPLQIKMREMLSMRSRPEQQVKQQETLL